MILLLIGGVLLTALATWMLIAGAGAIVHYRQNLRGLGLERIRVLPAQVIFIGCWSIGLVIGLAMIWLYIR